MALEYGQAMTVRVCKADGETMRASGAGLCVCVCVWGVFVGPRGADGAVPSAAVVVVQNATVLELKKALRRHVQLRQARQGGAQHLSW